MLLWFSLVTVRFGVGFKYLVVVVLCWLIMLVVNSFT